MKKIPNFILLFFLSFPILSQEILVNWGKYEKFGMNIYGKEIVFETDSTFFVLERENRDVNVFLINISRTPRHFINVYDSKKFNLIARNEIIFPNSDKVDYFFELNDIIGVDNEILLLLNATESKSKNLKLLAQKLDNTGKQSGQFFELDEVLPGEKQGIFQRRNAGDFDVVISPDQKHFGVIRFEAFSAEKEKTISLKIISAQFKTEWSGSVKLPYKDDFYDVTKYQIGNNGEFYLLGRTWKTLEKEGLSGKTRTKIARASEGKPNYNYSFLVFNSSQESYKEFEIDLKDKYITDISFDISYASNSLVCAGFYSNEREGSIKGTFSLSINLDNKNINYTHQKDFSNEFLSQFVSERRAEKIMEGLNDDFELNNFRMDDLIIKNDGSSVLVAEKYFVSTTTQSYTDANGLVRTTTTYTYTYGDVIVIHFNPSGEIGWYVRVPKNQVTQDDGGPYSSYILDVEDHKIYLIFNDHKSNLERLKKGEEIKNMGNPKKSATILVSIDNEGKMERDFLFSAEEQELVFRPKSSWYRRDILKSNKVYLFGISYGLFKKTQFKFGSIEFVRP